MVFYRVVFCYVSRLLFCSVAIFTVGYSEGAEAPNADVVKAKTNAKSISADLAQSRLARRWAASQEEAMGVVAYADKRIHDTLTRRREVTVLQADPKAVESFEEFEDLVWDNHVYRSELNDAMAIAKAADSFQQKYLDNEVATIQLKNVPGYEAVDFNRLRTNLKKVRRELHERDLKLRHDRIRLSIKSLSSDKTANKTATIKRTTSIAKSRLWAGYSLQQDGDKLLEALQLAEANPKRSFGYITELNDPKIRAATRKRIRTARQKNDMLLVKSGYLFDGLRWWFRGRYGRGAENNGLLKAPSATINLRAQNAINLPRRPPTPTDPAEPKGDKPKARVPDYDRRHHYIWAQKPPVFVTQTMGTFFC